MIKTFVSNGNAWNMVTKTGVASNVVDINVGMNTWDPSKINWNDYTTIPIDVTWVGIDPYAPGTSAPMPGVMPVTLDNTFLDGSSSWSTTAVYTLFSKPAGVRPDVLMGFFSQYLHALMFMTDESTYVMPFMERIGLIWIQHEPNKWTAYDRKEFYEFIDNPDATTFTGRALNKRDIQKRISEAKDE